MGPVSGIVVYLLVWWVVLFAILPLGVRSSTEGNAGPPQNPDIKKKFLLTTLISVIIWAIIYVLIDIRIVDFRAMTAPWEQ